MSGKEPVEQGVHPCLAVRALGCSRISLKGMFVLTAVAGMEAHQCCDYEHPRIGRRLGYRPLPLLDPGETALESARHFRSVILRWIRPDRCLWHNRPRGSMPGGMPHPSTCPSAPGTIRGGEIGGRGLWPVAATVPGGVRTGPAIYARCPFGTVNAIYIDRFAECSLADDVDASVMVAGLPRRSFLQ